MDGTQNIRQVNGSFCVDGHKEIVEVIGYQTEAVQNNDDAIPKG